MRKDFYLSFGLIFLLSFLFINIDSNAQMNKIMNEVSKARKAGNTTKGKIYKTYSLGYGIGFSSLDYRHDYSIFEQHTFVGEESITAQYNIKPMQVETEFKIWLTELSEYSGLNLTIGARGTLYNIFPEEYKVGENQSYQYSLLGNSIGFPVGLEFVYGGMATLKKTDKTSLGFGFGVQPTAYETYFGSDKYMTLKVKPYMKLTAGFFAGIQWNFFMTYVPGNIHVIDFKPSDDSNWHTYVPGDRSYVRMTQGNLVSFGLSVAPLSFLWDDRF